MDLNHLHLHVRDVGRSSAYYERWFGFRPSVTHGDVSFLRNGEGFDLALAPAEHPERLPSWFHVGSRLGNADDVRALRLAMAAAGVDVSPIVDEGDLVSFRAADPDGYGLEVYWEPDPVV